jgi:hypothetical protein
MLKRLIPNLNGVGKPMRSSTTRNLDSVFNAIILMLNLLPFTWTTRLVTACSTAFQRIQGLLMDDPTATVASLKVAHKAYFEHVRGRAAPPLSREVSYTDLRGDSTTQQLPTIVESLISLRTLLIGESVSTISWFDTIALSILNLHRVIVIPPVHDFKTITEGPGDKVIASGLWTPARITELLARVGITPDEFQRVFEEKCKAQEHIIMSTAGPNGKASWSAFSDAKAWLLDTDLLGQYRNWCEGCNMARFYRDLVRTARIPSVDAPGTSKLLLGRIHTFEEWGGKTRHVAIIDYWTQLVLTPLHDTIFHFLRLLSTDATHDQDEACRVIQAWTMHKESELNSFDLTAATDRLPIGLQTDVLGVLLGKTNVAKNWSEMLIGRDYMTATNEFIRYGTGAPMGAKSNWAMLALVHHLIIQDAASQAGHEGSFEGYRVCGDDSCIHGSTTGSKYRLIVGSLGLAINNDKSVLNEDGLLSAAEFCKRQYINGHEYSALPIKLIAKTAMNGRLAPQLQSELIRRGFNPEGTVLAHWFAGLIDRESMANLILLNALPTILTGLRGTITLTGPMADYNNWYDKIYPLTLNDIVQAYTYTAIVEQLQRLDALLRQTEQISNAIRLASGGYTTVDLDTLGWDKTFRESAVGQKLLGYRAELSIFHPIVLASKAEATRVFHLLSQLAAGSNEIDLAARLRLFDSFRNVLASVWDSEVDARGQADRSLLDRSLDTLDRLIHGGKNDSITFTTMLSYLQRLWSVTWRLGENVRINSTKSKVTMSTPVARQNYTDALDSIHISGRFASRRQVLPPTVSSKKSPPPRRGVGAEEGISE